MRRAGAASLAVALLVAGGCGAEPAPPPPGPVSVAWREAVLPLPAGGAGAVVARDVVACPGAWFVVGAVRDAQGGTRPAAWSSADGSSWAPLVFETKTFYGRQNVLWSAACRDARLVALGAKAGGAHGYPRTSSWRQTADGVVREVSAPFELFGGPRALNVAQVEAGPAGFLISGNRMSGAAVWVSPDGARFGIQEGVPPLASDAGGATWAFDGAAVAGGWVVVGGWVPAGRTDRDALGWRSPDSSSWRRVAAAGASAAYEELQRVTVLDVVPVAAGVRGSVFGVWRLDGDVWRPVGAFGAVRPGGGSAVRSLSAVGGRLFAVTADGSAFSVWASDDGGAGWRPVGMPVGVSFGADHAVSVAGEAGRVVLMTDDGSGGRVHVAETGT